MDAHNAELARVLGAEVIRVPSNSVLPNTDSHRDNDGIPSGEKGTSEDNTGDDGTVRDSR